MESLKTTIGTIFFYVENGIVFNISTVSDGKTHALKGVSGNLDTEKEALVPSFTVTKNDKTTRYFLTNFIDDGDSYESTVFKKDPHVDGGTVEEEPATIPQYYKNLCEIQIKKSILERPTADFDFFDEHKEMLGIPLFMLNGEDYTVSGVEQITFNESYFDNAKEDVVKSEVWKAGNGRAHNFGYELTTPKENLEVAELS
jgi:hypothetical protein